ncbi:MAG: DUF4241 domain-containing protein [Myxococcales bacterium]|nr:DUF4241 domain-containing protein [Myxococcales bacterium]
MSQHDQAIERVAAFLTAYGEAHARAADLFRGKRVDFAQWRALAAEVAGAHFVEGAGAELGHSYGTPPLYEAEEPVVGAEGEGDAARVQTSCRDRFHEFELRRQGGGWRIARVRTLYDPPGTLFVPPEERARFEEPGTSPLREISGVDVAGDRLFQHGREVHREHGDTVVEVRDVGVLRVTSGVLATGDLGYRASSLQPLALRVPPGTYRVQVAVAFERNAALRVVLSDHPVVAWRAADDPGGGHIVGSDAANVAVVDANSLLGTTSWDKERAFDAWVRDEAHPVTHMLSLAGPDDGVIAASGWGDGAYPVFWGLDADGAPAVLLVDFLVLAEFLTRQVDVPVDEAVPDADALAAEGLVLALSSDKRRTFLEVGIATPVEEVTLLGADGEVLVSTDDAMERRGGGDRWRFAFPDPELMGRVRALRVVLPAGRRN